MPSSSSIRLAIEDLARLMGRFPSPHAERLRVAREGGRLLVRAEGVRLPSPLVPAFDATFEVAARLVEGERNVVAVHLQAERLPLGLQVVLNPFLDGIVRRILPLEAAGFVEVRSPSLLWVRLEAIPDHGRPFAELVSLTGLTVPGPEGSAAEATFRIRPGPDGASAA